MILSPRRFSLQQPYPRLGQLTYPTGINRDDAFKHFYQLNHAVNIALTGCDNDPLLSELNQIRGHIVRRGLQLSLHRGISSVEQIAATLDGPAHAPPIE